MTEKKPNIVFFFTDQQRWDTCGCYGQELPVTPELDKMAGEGVLFENAFTCQPVCGPARACIQTGKYALETGCFTNGIQLPVDEKTVAHYFNENGYETSYIGKWHLASDRRKNIHLGKLPVPRNLRGGWQRWLAADVLESSSHPYEGVMFDEEGNSREFKDRFRVDVQTDWAIEYLRKRDDTKPFFLFISYLEPHFQNDMGMSIAPPELRDKFKDYKIPGDLRGLGGTWEKEYPDYLGCCKSLDMNLGRIREELRKQGIDEDTLIIFTSDHGSHFKTRNSEYKRSCHDGCLKIPMVICGPGFKGGKKVEEMASLIDMAPTFLNAAGIEKPQYMKGRPLHEISEGNPVDWPQEVFAQISESHLGRAVRTKKWTYAVWLPDRARGGGIPSSDFYIERYLYDNENDPHQRNNLVTVPEYDSVREELAVLLKKKMLEAGEMEPRIYPCPCLGRDY
ncbi:MAG: arylsulfatase [Lentisphaerae bacterium GWF2_44_16]|nr:MAG: arylsulfatase [Lentisphaerae bacterium GWF2_44_16]